MRTLISTFMIMLTLTLTICLRSPLAGAQGPHEDKRAAREHFEKGVAAFADKRFGEAADDFEAAYRIDPAFQVLYNIGQVDVALGRSVEAIDAFADYLGKGGPAIAGERRREVQAEIDKQSARIGAVTVATHPEAADIRLDGRLIGRTPLGRPIRANPGRHTIEALLVGHLPQNRDIEIAPGSSVTLQLTLDALPRKEPPAAAPVMLRPTDPVARVTSPGPAPGTLAMTETATSSPAMRPMGWQRVSGLVLVIGGLATAATGGVLAYRGANRAGDARDQLLTLRDARTFDDRAWMSATDDYNAGRDENRRGWIVAGVGAAIVTGGIVLVASAPARADVHGRSVALAPWLPASPTSAGVVMNGAF